MKLVPFSSYGKPYTPPPGVVDPKIDMTTPVRDQVNRMDAVEYFTLLAELMKTNPPAAVDAPEVAKFARTGLVPGQDFDASKLKADFVKRVPEVGFDRIMLQFKINRAIRDVDGWGYTLKTGVYGTDYLMRALITAIGLGANRPQDAVYPVSQKDVEGRDYDGANKYVVHFDKDQTPPAEGFWSITMYDPSYFFVAYPINLYSISPRQGLKANADGSIDLYVQHDSPGADKEFELASGARGQVHPDDAPLLAGRKRTLDPRRDVDHSAGEEGVMARGDKIEGRQNSLPHPGRACARPGASSCGGGLGRGVAPRYRRQGRGPIFPGSARPPFPSLPPQGEKG